MKKKLSIFLVMIAVVFSPSFFIISSSPMAGGFYIALAVISSAISARAIFGRVKTNENP